MKKSYINQAEEVNSKMIMNPTVIVQGAVQYADYYAYGEINVLYPSIWHGTLWAVEYIVDSNKVISERCCGGVMIYTSEQGKYPKIPHEIILDFFNNFMKDPESSIGDINTIDLEKELSARNIPISVLSGENKKEKNEEEVKVQNSNYMDFNNNKKEYDNRKRHNLNKKIDYIITQMDVLFRILQDISSNQILIQSAPVDSPSNNTMLLSDVDNTITPAEIKGYTDSDMITINRANASETPLKSTKNEIINELNLYSINPDYVGAQLIIQLCIMAPIHGITTDSDYDYMCKTVYPKDINYAKRNFTFIRKKINQYNSSIKFNNNKEMLDHFIELCY